MAGIVSKVYCRSLHFSFHSLQVYSLHFCRKFRKSLSLFKVLSPSFVFKWIAVINNAFEICRNVKLLQPFLGKLFDIRFSYKHCNFSRACLLVMMASKSVTRSMEAFRSKKSSKSCLPTYRRCIAFFRTFFFSESCVFRAALGINY